MKVLFLDVDGILNSRAFLIAQAGERKILNITDFDPRSHLDPVRIARLNEIVRRAGCEVVVSSSWRHPYDKATLLGYLRERGYGGDILDYTPSLPGHERHVEIKRWLARRHVAPSAFVVLDDDRDAGVGLENHFVRPLDGIEDEHVEQAIRILGGA